MTEQLAEVFSSRVRAAVLSFVLPRPHLGFSLTDFSRRLGLPISSVQHECYKLERIGILVARRSGNARLYRIDRRCPLISPLAALITAAIGPAACLDGVVEEVSGLEIVFLTGIGALPGLAAGQATGPSSRPRPASDHGPMPAGRPHLVVIGDVALDVLEELGTRAEWSLGLPPTTLEVAFFRPDDWRARIAEHNPYVMELLTGPRIMVRDPGIVTSAV